MACAASRPAAGHQASVSTHKSRAVVRVVTGFITAFTSALMAAGQDNALIAIMRFHWPNQLAEWELRVGDFRVFYDVDAEGAVVKIEAIGYKQGSKLFVHGEEYVL